MSDGLRIEISSVPSQAGGKKIYFLAIGDGFYISEVSKVKDNPRDMRDEVKNIRKDLVKGV